MTCAVFAFQECFDPAARLAEELGIACKPVSVHRFPDGESRVQMPDVASTSLVYRSLDHANEKIFELLLAASALRDGGAQRVVLVVPYLGYMRQDRAFHVGEAVSQKVLGAIIAAHFDALITLDPHLHRIRSLSEVMPGLDAASVSAAPALADALQGTGAELLVGPDGESWQWVQAIARLSGLPMLLGEKRRKADRQVDLVIEHVDRAKGKNVVLVDDLVSSGATMQAAAQLLLQAGARSVSVMATHCLASADALKMLGEAGVTAIHSTQTVPGPTASVAIAGVLAEEIRRRSWCSAEA